MQSRLQFLKLVAEGKYLDEKDKAGNGSLPVAVTVEISLEIPQQDRKSKTSYVPFVLAGELYSSKLWWRIITKSYCLKAFLFFKSHPT